MKTVSLKSKAMKLEGVPQLVKTVRELGATLSGEGAAAFSERLKGIVMKPAMVIRDEAKDLVPVVTGTLKEAIFAGALKDKVGALVGVKGVYYGAFIEFGTSRSEAHPYFRPALNSTRPLYANMIAGDLKTLIDDVARSDAWHATDGGGGK
jgi:HK97 gp10 family phage protein